MELFAGTVICERYQLERVLGTGGMGTVWAARHTVTGKDVALKILGAHTAAKPEARKRFIREARAASRVRHPNVVAVHDVLELDDKSLVMVMDRLYGETLGERLGRLGRLSVAETATILAPVVSAVGSAHAAGVVHRDLKPDNIFLAEDLPEVRVLDFGIAKLHEDDSAGITNTGALLGTPYYMSPEQIFGEKDIDARADIWSLGVILYECLTGRRPFEGDNAGQVMKAILRGNPEPLEALVPGLPPRVVALVARMLELDRERRPADLREPLAVLSEDTTVAAPPFSAPRTSLPPGQSSDALPPITADTPAPSLRIRTRAPMLDTAAPIETSEFRERRGGVLALVAVAAIGAALAGAWLLLRPPAVEPSSAAATPSESTAPSATVAAPAVSSSAPAAAPPASSTPSTPPRRATPSVPPPSAAPRATGLPHGVQGEVPF